MAIADLAGGSWPEKARNVAVVMSGDSEAEDSSVGVMLLTDLAALFDERNTVRLSSRDICDALADLEDRPWPEFSRGKPITPNQLSKLLKPFGVRPKTIRLETGTKKGYEVADFAKAFARYIPPSVAVTPSQVYENNDLQENPPVTQSPNVTGRKDDKASKYNDVTAVTDRAGG